MGDIRVFGDGSEGTRQPSLLELKCGKKFMRLTLLRISRASAELPQRCNRKRILYGTRSCMAPAVLPQEHYQIIKAKLGEVCVLL